MYNNNFILSVKNSSGQILRETNNHKVYLPFHSEYKIYLKNDNNKKAQVKVSIDGTDVLNGNALILNAYDCLDLERFVLDNNLNNGKRFKFVPLSDSRVQDPTSSNNGIIKAEFTLEQNLYFRPSIKLFNNRKYASKYIPDAYCVNNANFSDNNTILCSASLSQKGATIEGSDSNQQFVISNIGALENTSTILTLQLLAPVQEYTVKSTKRSYCTQCGKRLKFNDKYCSRCGAKLEHPFLRDLD